MVEASVPGDVTRLLGEVKKGSGHAFNELFAHVYDDLKEVAGARMRDERPGHTLSSTALVHEAFVRLVGREQMELSGRAHFFAVAASAMRRILVDHARARGAGKRGGGNVPISLEGLEEALGASTVPPMADLHEAMERLAEFNERGAQVVELRFFGGLTHDEIAEVMELSEPTVRRAWTMARAWLRRELMDGGG